jgi:hypothetical protein
MLSNLAGGYNAKMKGVRKNGGFDADEVLWEDFE